MARFAFRVCPWAANAKSFRRSVDSNQSHPYRGEGQVKGSLHDDSKSSPKRSHANRHFPPGAITGGGITNSVE